MNREGAAGNPPNPQNPQNPQACASCKHQRKKCDETCELAPHFPLNRYYEYQNAHKLFGLSNIVKIMNSVEPHQRQAAADSILQEGNARLNDPVHGCLGIVRNLNSQIEYYEKELALVNQQLEFFRDREKMQQQKQQWENLLPSSSVPPFKSSSLQHEFDGYNYQTPVLPNLTNIGDMKIFDHGYNYQPTLDEGVDLKLLDIQHIDKMLDPYLNLNELAPIYFDEPGESSAAAPKTNGKMPLDLLDDEKGKMTLDLLDDEKGKKPLDLLDDKEAKKED